MYERYSFRDREFNSLLQALGFFSAIGLLGYGYWRFTGVTGLVVVGALLLLAVVMALWCALASNKGLRIPPKDDLS
jgi:hypothetical protein